MKKIIVCVILFTLLLGLFAGCGKSESTILSQEEAHKIALEAAGLSKREVDDIHTHLATYQDAPCYSVHITAGDTEYEVIVHTVTGEVLHMGNDAH